MTPGGASRLDAWLAARSSLVIVGAVSALWLALSVGSPDAMTWLNLNPATQTITEGPVDALENLILGVCLAGWCVIARRTSDDRLRFVLAVLMIAQLALVLGEEVDWGQTFGLRATARHRNLRMYLRDVGILQPWNDAIAPTAYLLLFLLTPLLPLAPVQRWLARAAPVRAERADALAVLALPGALALTVFFHGREQSLEPLQLAAYLVVLSITVRILRATRPGAPRPDPVPAA